MPSRPVTMACLASEDEDPPPRTLLEDGSRARRFPVVVGGIPSGSTTPLKLQQLADAIFESFQFVPACTEFVEQVLYCRHDPDDFAVLLFTSEILAEMFVDACSDENNFPFQLCGKQLVVKRNYSPTMASTTKLFQEGMLRLDVSSTIYVSDVGRDAGTGVFKQQLEQLLRGFNKPNVIYVGTRGAYVEFKSRMAAAKLLQVCKDAKERAINLMLCRSSKCIPLLRSILQAASSAKTSDSVSDNIRADKQAVSNQQTTKKEKEKEKEKEKQQPVWKSSEWEQQTSLIVTNLTYYDPERLRKLLGLLLTMVQPDVNVGNAIRHIAWSTQRQTARVRLDSPKTVDSIMDAYIEHTPAVCFSDFPLTIYRDPYVPPGALFARDSFSESSEIATVIMDGFGPSMLQAPLRGAVSELLVRQLSKKRVLKTNELLLKDFYYKQGASYASAKVDARVASVLVALQEPLPFCGRSLWFTNAPDGPISPDYVQRQIQTRRKLRWKQFEEVKASVNHTNGQQQQ